MQARPSAAVDLVADITCPWCTIARRRLDAALVALAAEGLLLGWVWRPFLLYPGAPPGGFAQQEHLLRRFGSAMVADRYHESVAEAGRAVGFDFRYERITVTPDTTDAHRLLLLAGESGHQPALADSLARAFFSDGEDISRPDVLAGLAAGVGMTAVACLAMLAGDSYRAEVTAFDAAGKRAGIRHVPTFCLYGRILAVTDVEDLAGALKTAHRALA